MKVRLITFITFTILSALPLFMSFEVKPRGLATTFAKCEISSAAISQCKKELTLAVISGALVWSAWILYFIICYRWVRFGYVSKNIRITGAIIGSLALLSTPLYGIIYVLPAVFLMLYIHFRVPYIAKA